MWDLKACPGKILRIKPSEIEFESNFSRISQHLRSIEYTVPFLLPKMFRIRPCKVEFEGDFSSLSQ